MTATPNTMTMITLATIAEDYCVGAGGGGADSDHDAEDIRNAVMGSSEGSRRTHYGSRAPYPRGSNGDNFQVGIDTPRDVLEGDIYDTRSSDSICQAGFDSDEGGLVLSCGARSLDSKRDSALLALNVFDKDKFLPGQSGGLVE